MGIAILIEGNTRLEMAVIDTSINIAADTSPVSTAAVPTTRVPTIEMDDPIALGIRTPASRKISKVTSIMIASKKAGNGTSSRCAIKLTRSSDGIIS